MKMFDKSKLAQCDLDELNQAIKRAAPKVRFWYSLPDTFFIEGFYKRAKGRRSNFCFIDQNEIACQTGATTDFDKMHEKYPREVKDKYNTQSVVITDADTSNGKFELKRIWGMKDLNVCVFNPRHPLLNVCIGKKTADLFQMDGRGLGNTYDAGVYFNEGSAILLEEDQNIAHRLELEYSPKGVLECSARTPSRSSSHAKSSGFDSRGNPLIYCDNPCCKGLLQNPKVIFEPKTGGVYHSSICFWKDFELKVHLTDERTSSHLIKTKAEKISLEQALIKYTCGELLQSRKNRKIQDLEFRKVAPLLYN